MVSCFTVIMLSATDPHTHFTMRQQFFSNSEKLKIVCTIVCTVSVLFIALHTPLEHTVGLLYSTHLCNTEIFSCELDLFVQILHVGVFCLLCLRLCCVFALCHSLEVLEIQSRIQRRVWMSVCEGPSDVLGFQTCRGTLTCFHTGPALSSSHKDVTVPLFS